MLNGQNVYCSTSNSIISLTVCNKYYLVRDVPEIKSIAEQLTFDPDGFIRSYDMNLKFRHVFLLQVMAILKHLNDVYKPTTIQGPLGVWSFAWTKQLKKADGNVSKWFPNSQKTSTFLGRQLLTRSSSAEGLMFY